MANNTAGTRKDDIRTGTTGTTTGTGHMAGSTGTGGMTGGSHGGTTGGTPSGATGVMDKARDVASNVVDRAKDAASTAADTARDWASTAGEKAGDALGAVGSSLGSLAGNVRESVPGGEYVADALESGTRYFQEHSFRDMTDDVAGVIRRNPIPALLVGIGIGFLIARSTSRS